MISAIEAILRHAGIPNEVEEAQRIVEFVLRDRDVEGSHARAIKLAEERAKGKPLAYLTGRATFMGVDMLTAPGALIPREETELLGRAALDVLKGSSPGEERRLIDMCCGSGNLVCGISSHYPGLRAWASDLTDGAVSLTRANVEHLSLGDRISVVQGDLFEPLAPLGLQETIDVVVCNPPYISTGKLARERGELLEHEPREAFDGGPYGDTIFRRVIRDAASFLKPSGVLLFEIGVGQHRLVSALFQRSKRYGPAAFVNDAAGEPRVIIAKKQPNVPA